MTKVWVRSRTVVNTDPQRRCYDGCNFSERIDHGKWVLFGEYETPEIAERVMKGFRCDRYEYTTKAPECSNSQQGRSTWPVPTTW